MKSTLLIVIGSLLLAALLTASMLQAEGQFYKSAARRNSKPCGVSALIKNKTKQLEKVKKGICQVRNMIHAVRLNMYEDSRSSYYLKNQKMVLKELKRVASTLRFEIEALLKRRRSLHERNIVMQKAGRKHHVRNKVREVGLSKTSVETKACTKSSSKVPHADRQRKKALTPKKPRRPSSSSLEAFSTTSLYLQQDETFTATHRKSLKPSSKQQSRKPRRKRTNSKQKSWKTSQSRTKEQQPFTDAKESNVVEDSSSVISTVMNVQSSKPINKVATVHSHSKHAATASSSHRQVSSSPSTDYNTQSDDVYNNRRNETSSTTGPKDQAARKNLTSPRPEKTIWERQRASQRPKSLVVISPSSTTTKKHNHKNGGVSNPKTVPQSQFPKRIESKPKSSSVKAKVDRRNKDRKTVAEEVSKRSDKRMGDGPSREAKSKISGSPLDIKKEKDRSLLTSSSTAERRKQPVKEVNIESIETVKSKESKKYNHSQSIAERKSSKHGEKSAATSVKVPSESSKVRRNDDLTSIHQQHKVMTSNDSASSNVKKEKNSFKTQEQRSVGKSSEIVSGPSRVPEKELPKQRSSEQNSRLERKPKKDSSSSKKSTTQNVKPKETKKQDLPSNEKVTTPTRTKPSSDKQERGRNSVSSKQERQPSNPTKHSNESVKRVSSLRNLSSKPEIKERATSSSKPANRTISRTESIAKRPVQKERDTPLSKSTKTASRTESIAKRPVGAQRPVQKARDTSSSKSTTNTSRTESIAKRRVDKETMRSKSSQTRQNKSSSKKDQGPTQSMISTLGISNRNTKVARSVNNRPTSITFEKRTSVIVKPKENVKEAKNVYSNESVKRVSSLGNSRAASSSKSTKTASRTEFIAKRPVGVQRPVQKERDTSSSKSTKTASRTEFITKRPVGKVTRSVNIRPTSITSEKRTSVIVKPKENVKDAKKVHTSSGRQSDKVNRSTPSVKKETDRKNVTTSVPRQKEKVNTSIRSTPIVEKVAPRKPPKQTSSKSSTPVVPPSKPTKPKENKKQSEQTSKTEKRPVHPKPKQSVVTTTDKVVLAAAKPSKPKEPKQPEKLSTTKTEKKATRPKPQQPVVKPTEKVVLASVKPRSVSPTALKKCQAIGDPHYTTFQGKYFDFYGIGDYVLAGSTDGDFIVHSRTGKWNSASVNTAFAVKLNNQNIVEYDIESDSFYVDGQQISIKVGDTITFDTGATAKRTGAASMTISSTNGAHLIATWYRDAGYKRYGSFGHISLIVEAPTDLSFSSGLCVDRSYQSVTATGILHDHVQRIVTRSVQPKQPTQAQVQAATEACRTAGLKGVNHPLALKACIADQVQTGSKVGASIAKVIKQAEQIADKKEKKWAQQAEQIKEVKVEQVNPAVVTMQARTQPLVKPVVTPKSNTITEQTKPKGTAQTKPTSTASKETRTSIRDATEKAETKKIIEPRVPKVVTVQSKSTEVSPTRPALKKQDRSTEVIPKSSEATSNGSVKSNPKSKGGHNPRSVMREWIETTKEAKRSQQASPSVATSQQQQQRADQKLATQTTTKSDKAKQVLVKPKPAAIQVKKETPIVKPSNPTVNKETSPNTIAKPPTKPREAVRVDPKPTPKPVVVATPVKKETPIVRPPTPPREAVRMDPKPTPKPPVTIAAPARTAFERKAVARPPLSRRR
ncbi:hypothetical protein C9374_012355 [Naegleria lovaniensis]|uniref:VWFD domain-containing protein n=1 Tax=Naegleria lovaniensis TaxID=51637 RepID=A0AA88KHV8_NAELO|nr:uncharacterized protein C9374_012355 [Naegleria lovaniensis]KAG2373252.1 hypothetical protein C9374_012355 [Naegleria lovaniensis]